MKKLIKNKKLIVIVAIILIAVILAIVITTNLTNNKELASAGYFATTANVSSNLVASYIKSGITIGGITGTLEVLDTSDADATPEDIAYGKTAYVNGQKIIGTYMWNVPLPDGFYYVGGTKDTGIIISDSPDDENKGEDYSTSSFKGNQFVWVPVENPDALFETSETVKLTGVTTTTDIYSKLTIRSGDSYTAGAPGTTNVREPDVLSSLDTSSSYYSILNFGSTKEMADSFVAEYKAMADSIKKYNGFYIGRYELTANGEKKGASLTNTNWYNLYKACQNVVQGKENVKSTMIYGVQWDATMDWLKKTIFKDDTSKVDTDSSSWGSYSSRIDTGSDTKYEANGIFDLAGNCYEWTQEAYSTSTRVIRRWLLRLFRLYRSSVSSCLQQSERFDQQLLFFSCHTLYRVVLKAVVAFKMPHTEMSKLVSC